MDLLTKLKKWQEVFAINLPYGTRYRTVRCGNYLWNDMNDYGTVLYGTVAYEIIFRIGITYVRYDTTSTVPVRNRFSQILPGYYIVLEY